MWYEVREIFEKLQKYVELIFKKNYKSGETWNNLFLDA